MRNPCTVPKHSLRLTRKIPASPIRKSYFNWMKFPMPTSKRSTRFSPATIWRNASSVNSAWTGKQNFYLPRSLGRGKRAQSPATPSSPPADSAAVPDPLVQETVLTHFQDRLDIRPIRRSRAVELRFDSQDPDLAAQAVNAVVENYIQKNFEARWAAAQKASGWLSQQLQDLKTKLEKSQDDLQKYAADNGLLYLVTDKGEVESIVNQSVREIQDELTKAEADRFRERIDFPARTIRRLRVAPRRI